MYLAIDIGGTKTLLARMKHDGAIDKSIKFPTPSSYAAFKKQLAENIAKLTTTPWKVVCVAAPGRIDREQGVIVGFGNLRWLDVPLSHDIQAMTNSKVLLENDAKLAGLSEARLLGNRYSKVLYITVSTGIGGALVVDGSLDPDLEDAEPGHMMLEHKGQMQKWESFASGKAIVARFGKRASDINDPNIWEIIAKDLSMGLIDLCAVLQPDIIVIGGGVGSHFNKFGTILNKELKQYESPLVKVPRVVGAKHPEEAVIYGCYELIKDYEKTARNAKN